MRLEKQSIEEVPAVAKQEPLALLDRDSMWDLIGTIYQGSGSDFDTGVSNPSENAVNEILELLSLEVPVLVPISTVKRWKAANLEPVDE